VGIVARRRVGWWCGEMDSVLSGTVPRIEEADWEARRLVLVHGACGEE
jgi:hypothetical protein